MQVLELDGKEDMWLLVFRGRPNDASDDDDDAAAPATANEAAAATAAACKAETEELMAALGEMQQVVNVGLVSLAPAAEPPAASPAAHMLSSLGVDVARLSSSPCTPQLVLLPFGEAKSELDDYAKCAPLLLS